MDINNLVITTINTATQLPVAPDEYDGASEKYITFTYVDERPAGFGDNLPYADTAYLQIQLVTPKKFNYLATKDTIRNALEAAGFSVTSISSTLGDVVQGTEKIRQTIFEANYTMPRTNTEV